MKTGIKPWTSLILARFQQLVWELPILEGIKALQKCCPDDSDLIFIESSSDLQVMKTAIKYWTSSILGQIGLFTWELFAI